MPNSKPELGAASMKVALSDSVITVHHGDDGTLLAVGTVQAGAWDALWKALKDIGVVNLYREGR